MAGRLVMIDLTKIILFRLTSFLQAADLVPAIIALRHGENELAGFLRAWQGGAGQTS